MHSVECSELDVVRTVIVHHEMYECLDWRDVVEVFLVLVVRHQVQDLLHPYQHLRDHCGSDVENDRFLLRFAKVDCFSQTVQLMRTYVFDGSGRIDEVSHHNPVAHVDERAVTFGKLLDGGFPSGHVAVKEHELPVSKQLVDDPCGVVFTFSPDSPFLVQLASKQNTRIIRPNGDCTDPLKIVIKGSQIQVKFFAGDLDERADEAVVEIIWVLNNDFAPDWSAVISSQSELSMISSEAHSASS